MTTNYFKNFGSENFQKLVGFCKRNLLKDKPLWYGTVYIGTQPLYIECHVKWISDKIDKFFVKTLPNQHVRGAKQLYLLNAGVPDFMRMPSLDPDVYFLNDDLLNVPNVIVHPNCIFLKNEDDFYMSVDQNDDNNFDLLGENHLLMRLFYYILQNTQTTVVHGSVVAYNGFGVLITGASGVGKSTLAAHCLTNGLQFVGDDRIALHIENSKIIANPVYTSISIKTKIPNIKYTDILRMPNKDKNVFILEKSQISDNIRICDVIEPFHANIDKPSIEPVSKNNIITSICNDYSRHSVLARSTNLIQDYKHIFNLLCNCGFYRINLSKSIVENAHFIIDLIKNKGL